MYLSIKENSFLAPCLFVSSNHNQDAGHIVRRTPLLADPQQPLATQLLVHAVDHFEENFLVIQQVGQAVGTQQEVIPLLHRLIKKVAFHPRLRPNGPGNQILPGIILSLLPGKFPPLDHQLHQGVVRRQTPDSFPVQKIAPAVAYIGNDRHLMIHI